MLAKTTLADRIEEAAVVLEPVVTRTPLQFSPRLSQKFGANIYLKREDQQVVRSFKLRGAFYKMSLLSEDERQRGVVTASAGNHAQGVAFACAHLKVRGAIYMPVATPNQKIEKVRRFGGEYVTIELTGETYDEAAGSARAYAEQSGAVMIPPFDDMDVIAGQGTVAKEIVDEVGDKIDTVVAAIGGGGLMSGLASYLKARNPAIRMVGVEPEGADSMRQSITAGRRLTLETIDTFVDGAAVQTVGERTFAIVSELVDTVLATSIGAVCSAMIDLYQDEGIITEPAGALPVAALDQIGATLQGKTVVVVVSGGNNDLLRYPEILEKSLIYKGLKHYFLVEFAQKPGQLKRLVNDVLGVDDDIVLFEYVKKTNREHGPALVGIELRRSEDLTGLLSRFKEHQIAFKRVSPDDLTYNFLI